MNAKDEHDTLIRIDERTKEMSKKMDAGDIRMKTIEMTVSQLPCAEHNTKIEVQATKLKLLNKLVWIPVIALVLAIAKEVYALIVK